MGRWWWCAPTVPGERLRGLTLHEVGFKNMMTRSCGGSGLWEDEGGGVKQVESWGSCGQKRPDFEAGTHPNINTPLLTFQVTRGGRDRHGR